MKLTSWSEAGQAWGAAAADWAALMDPWTMPYTTQSGVIRIVNTIGWLIAEA